MRPLPEKGLAEFEALLRGRWWERSWYLRRGALACSLGLLGLRWCEVASAEPGDVEPGGSRLHVRTGKRGRPRTIEAPAGMLEALLAMRAVVAGGDLRLFVRSSGQGMTYQDVRRYVKAATTAVFGRAFSFHCFRHTAAVRVYLRTGDVLAVSRFLGHRSLRWTNDYLQSLLVVDTGGPVAFAGGGLAAGVRLFDPAGVIAPGAGETVAADGMPGSGGEGEKTGRGDRGGGDHECLEHLVPSRCVHAGRRAGRCELCGQLFEWGWREPMAEAKAVVRAVAEERSAGVGEPGGRRSPRVNKSSGSGCLHPELVERGGMGDGRVRMVCAACRRFVGYAPPAAEGNGAAAGGDSGGRRELF